MMVNNGTEGQSINPTCREILDIHISITVCCSLTPKFGGGNYYYRFCTSCSIADGELDRTKEAELLVLSLPFRFEMWEGGSVDASVRMLRWTFSFFWHYSHSSISQSQTILTTFL